MCIYFSTPFIIFFFIHPCSSLSFIHVKVNKHVLWLICLNLFTWDMKQEVVANSSYMALFFQQTSCSQVIEINGQGSVVVHNQRCSSIRDLLQTIYLKAWIDWIKQCLLPLYYLCSEFNISNFMRGTSLFLLSLLVNITLVSEA